MTREEAINIIRDTYHTDTEFEALKVLIPELRDSDDERIRKKIIEIIRMVSGPDCDMYLSEEKQAECLAWLEKRKELPFVKDVVPGLPGLYFYDGERMHFQGNPAMEENPYDFAMSQQEKQKEQKPAEINVKALLAADRLASAEMTGRLKERSEILENPKKYGLQKPAEWSEDFIEEVWTYLNEYRNLLDGTDKQEIANSIWKVCDELKSLRPQPHTVSIENANKFGELEYERGVKDGLSHHWKPSKEQMDSLRDTIIQTKGYSYSMYLPELYEQLKKLGVKEEPEYYQHFDPDC